MATNSLNLNTGLNRTEEFYEILEYDGEILELKKSFST